MAGRTHLSPAGAAREVTAHRLPDLDRVTARTVLRGLAAEPGLVVLSGDWAGGGLVIARDPAQQLTDPIELGAVLDTQASSESLVDLVGGGWFGWLGYPQPTRAGGSSACWFGWYPNVVRFRAYEQSWYDEALPDVPAEDGISRRREAAIASVRAAAHAGAAGRPHARGYRMGLLRADIGAGRYASAVERCIDRIRAGDIYQANICLQLDADFSGDPAALFADLVEELQPAYAALVCTAERAVVSVSPELFLRRRGRDVTSAPIKGTVARSPGGDPDRPVERLRHSDKDRAENVMIVDLVRNDLARVAVTGSVTVPSLLQVEPHCGVWHLISRVTATLRGDASDRALLDATFPPGSVTGAPKLSAQRIIDELEASPRGVYTGAVGYVSPAAGLELNVAIRTIEISGPAGGRRAALGVGAGITVGSTPVQEWWECLDKAAPLAAAMGTSVLTDGVPRDAYRGRSAAGVFETMLVLDGTVIALGAHLDRLRRSTYELFDEPLPSELALPLADLERAAVGQAAPGTAAAGSAARLRVDVAPDADGHLAVRWTTGPVGPPVRMSAQPGLQLALAQVADGFGGHKWADRATIDELERPSAGQLLVIDSAGRCLETTRGNVIVLRGATIVTPPLDGRILPGITRRVVLDLAQELGMSTEIREIGAGELSAADGLAICGSLAGLNWVRSCPLGSWPAPTPVMVELSDQLLVRWRPSPAVALPAARCRVE